MNEDKTVAPATESKTVGEAKITKVKFVPRIGAVLTINKDSIWIVTKVLKNNRIMLKQYTHPVLKEIEKAAEGK